MNNSSPITSINIKECEYEEKVLICDEFKTDLYFKSGTKDLNDYMKIVDKKDFRVKYCLGTLSLLCEHGYVNLNTNIYKSFYVKDNFEHSFFITYQDFNKICKIKYFNEINVGFKVNKPISLIINDDNLYIKYFMTTITN